MKCIYKSTEDQEEANSGVCIYFERKWPLSFTRHKPIRYVNSKYVHTKIYYKGLCVVTTTSVVVKDLRLKDEDKDKESSFKDKDKDLGRH